MTDRIVGEVWDQMTALRDALQSAEAARDEAVALLRDHDRIPTTDWWMRREALLARIDAPEVECGYCGRRYDDLSPAELSRMALLGPCPFDDCPGHDAPNGGAR